MKKPQSITDVGADRQLPVNTEVQLEVLTSPIRQEIVDALSSAGPCTVAELGRYLQRAPDSLYPHLEQLAAVGLMVERSPRKDGRHVAAVIDVPGRPLRIDYDRLAHSPLVPKVIERALKLCLRDLRRALSRHAPGTAVDGPPVRAGRAKGWLSASEYKEVQHHLDCINKLLEGGRPGAGRESYAVGFVLSPASGTRRKP